MTSNFVVGLMLMGAREEPYLGAVLESLRDAVDVLVVNDNSGQEKSSNRRTLEESALFRKEQVEIVEAPFDGFANARNRCLENIRQRYSDKAWILVVDCDEVHGAQLPHLTREVAPALPTRVGVVDGYFVQFMQSFDYFISLDRRHNLMFRLTPEARWECDVHEQLQGLHGTRLCLPYVYYHYGYVMPNSQILDKWQQYQSLGDGSLNRDELAGADLLRMFEHEVPRCMPYSWGHPPTMKSHLQQPADAAVTLFKQMCAERLHQPVPWMVSVLRRLNYRLRVFWRALQAFPMAPRVWGTLLRMAL